MANLQIIVVTPEETSIDRETSFVAVPLFDGELGVAANHAPLIGRLGVGELRFEAEGTTHRYYVDGGFVQIADNVVSVMTNRAIPSAELQADAEQSALDEARAAQANSEELMEARDKRVEQARARLRLASK